MLLFRTKPGYWLITKGGPNFICRSGPMLSGWNAVLSYVFMSSFYGTSRKLISLVMMSLCPFSSPFLNGSSIMKYLTICKTR